MSGLLIVGSGYAGMNFTAVSKTSAAASAVIAKPHFLHSNVCTFGNPMGRKIDWANRIGLLQLGQQPYLPSFIGGWIVLKFALGWQRERKTKEALTGSMLALIGNVLSFAIAIAIGAWLNPNALDVRAKAN